ncbi:MAG: PKD domain-containing protein [Solirubrobacteraceae bacterium]
MRRYSLIARRLVLALSCSLVGSLAVVASAQAVVVTVGSAEAGVALVPPAREDTTTAQYLNNAGISIDTSSGSCADPAASTEPDILTVGSWPLSAPAQPLCWHNGPVLTANETYALEWEGQSPNTYWSTTKQYVQDFLGDVAAASGKLVNPYSDTTQYWDGPNVNDRAAYNSVFGGGCDDNGTANCKFGSMSGSGPGNPLPAAPGDCPVTGDNIDGGSNAGGSYSIPNNDCVTDADIQNEVKTLIDHDSLIAHTQPGYKPLVTVLTPPGVIVCLDSTSKLCSENAQLSPPPPVLSTAGTGGTVTQGAYQVEETYVMTAGSTETVPSAPASITTSGSTSTITIDSPPPAAGVSGWYAYITGPDGSVYHRQEMAGSPVAIGTSVNLTTPPVGGPTPPLGNASFCSYHSDVFDAQSDQTVSYVVQPWTAFTSCDEPDVPAVPPYAAPDVLEKSAGQRLVSPLSQSSMAAIVNPFLSGWFGLDGLEIDDQNACQPFGHGLDTFNFGNSGMDPYYLQRESNNASVVDNDPWTYSGCLPSDVLQPTFVSPTAIDQGDTLDLDGSNTASSLAIPNANYSWNFGDGSQSGTGPSVEHTYNQAGTFNVTLTVTDRGGNKESFAQPVQVLGPTGQPGPPLGGTTSSGGGGAGSGNALNVHLQLMPQSLKAVLRNGISVRVTSNAAANGIATVVISRKAAKRAHIKVGKAATVRIGLGTVSSVQNGTITLHLHLSKTTAAKLRHLRHIAMTIRLALVASGNQRIAVDAAASY